MAELTLTVGRDLLAVASRAAAAPSPLMWYVTRMCAVAAYVLLTVSVALGTLQSLARRSGERVSWLVDELHQFLATLAGVLVAAHLLSLMLDTFLPFSLGNILLPISEPYRPFAVNLGVFAFYGMVLLLLTSWLRRRIPYRLWRGIHYVSLATVALVTAHGLLAGSDAQELWMRAVYAAAGGSLSFVFLMRLFFSRPPKTASTPSVAISEEDSRVLVVPPRGGGFGA